MREAKYDYSRVFEQFVAPPVQDIRERYTYRIEKKEKEAGKWPHPSIVIEQHNEDGSVEDIYSYVRNYSMAKTFEPFRQLKDGVWRDYALISPEYVRFSVLDLQTREIIATEPYPTITEKHHERWRKMGYEKWCEEQPVGTEKPGWGFCPVEFYVPDWAEQYERDSLHYLFEMKDKEPRFLYDEEDFMRFTGQYALYMGCVWGDDSGGWKIRHIDLSRISEGIVTSDERYGYIQFAGDSLRKDVNIWSDMNRMTIPVELYADIDTGKAFRIEANWRDDDDD